MLNHKKIDKRLNLIDFFRGIAITQMILYHFLWDLVYLFNIDIAWYKTDAAYIWQQSICWTFILVAGFSWSLGKQNLKRGILLLGCGFMISIITAIFIPEARVKYGILTFIGSCILIWCVLDQFMQKINYGIGMLGSFTLFLIARQWRSMVHFSQSITHSIWAKEILAYIGFPQAGFNSTDYFPLLPWVFLFATGYFTYHFALERNKLHQICRSGYVPYINFLGKHSFIVYMIHQPICYILGSGIYHITIFYT